MLSSALKQSLTLAVIMAALVGCSSTSTTTDSADADSAVSSAADSSAVDTTDTMADEAVEALDTVFYFDFDKSMLKPEARAALTAHAENLKAAPKAVRLEGHADERGTREYNMALGERRAKAVRDYLVLQGVDASMIETVSYGEEYPAVVGATEAAYEMNRRVEMK
ncbi:peptidoglycan-associated lipoprotein Pal [Pseudomaricurvus sp. HS19]|uniref:peptidoglycan-associated lipoprotein Pal n=1 Tax=Pseudomaricurvus sp. HS19 TaxID=2692626 RepID=UPI00136A4866|nr:peptidoglycan-associated lipoprotein Pal [Pseudomaricurvus sp. HS19]MYM65027.1 peptidoglycan-associated lipoprotein Pal [Pseudomaricurvus sp. HS19]